MKMISFLEKQEKKVQRCALLAPHCDIPVQIIECRSYVLVLGHGTEDKIGSLSEGTIVPRRFDENPQRVIFKNPFSRP